jgi:hypothetical protein
MAAHDSIVDRVLNFTNTGVVVGPDPRTLRSWESRTGVVLSRRTSATIETFRFYRFHPGGSLTPSKKTTRDV